MSTRIVFIIFTLLLFIINPGTQAIATEEDIDPGIPTCGMLATSKVMNYAVNVGQDISTASFALNWRNEASNIKMDIQTPGGEWIRPERDSFVTYKESNTSRTYLIERPATGRWVLRVSPGNQQTVHEDYCIFAHLVNMKSPDQYTARFSGLFSDNAKDEDKDGIDDHIVIEASVSVKAPGKYSATGVLYNEQNEEKIRINNAAFLNIGVHRIKFDLSDLKSLGPYRMRASHSMTKVEMR
jgi:hypothetical protein